MVFLKRLLILIVLFYSSLSYASTWYVRPYAASNYGSDDGTSYDSAWNGLDDVNWASISNGDTLYISDSHGYSYTNTGVTSLYAHTVLTVSVSGVTIAQDPLHTGTWYRTTRAIKAGSTWSNPYAGIYSINSVSAFSNLYENGVLMNEQSSDLSTVEEADFAGWAAGDWQQTATYTLYVKTTGEDVAATYNYQGGFQNAAIIISAGVDNITVNSPSLMSGHIQINSSSSGDTCENITITSPTIKNADYGVVVYGSNNNIQIKGTPSSAGTIQNVGDGIYFINDSTAGTTNSLIEYLNISDVVGDSPDNHAVGIQAGTGNIIRYCTMDNALTGVTFYGGTGYATGGKAYYNKITDIYRSGTSNNPNSGHGAALDYHGELDAGLSNIEFYYNIINGSEGEGIRLVNPIAGSTVRIFGNTIYNCTMGIYTFFPVTTTGLNCYVENNIVHTVAFNDINSDGAGQGLPVVFAYTYFNNATRTYLTENYNLFYPNATSGTPLYYTQGGGYAVSPVSYADHNKAGSGSAIYNINSITSDPQLTNVATGDFTISSGSSPAVGAGEVLTGYDNALLPSSVWPNAVETGDQDNYNDGKDGWEIGAYLWGPLDATANRKLQGVSSCSGCTLQ